MFNKFIEFHRKNSQREIARMQMDLDVYEEKYNINSASFYEAFDRGDLEDSTDYILIV